MDDVVVKLVAAPDELEAATAVRRRVFVEEQGVPLEEEYDEYDAIAIHAAAVCQGRIIGTGRLFRHESGEGRIGRMAVDVAWRRQGVGGRLLEALEAEARRLKMPRVVLHAQTYVHEFYARHGYVPYGPRFMEAGIEHVAMRKELV